MSAEGTIRAQQPEGPIATLAGRPLLSNRGVPLSLDWVKQIRVNTSAVERRAQSHVARRTVKKEWQAAWLLRAISCMDLTTLSGDDTDERVRRLCAKGRQPLQHELVKRLGIAELQIKVGAICVYHRFVETALRSLEGSGIRVAAVSTGFPAGLSPLQERVAEIRRSVAAGAHEIDTVITRAHVFGGRWQQLYDEIAEFKQACGSAHMKVILGTGDLLTLRNVARASFVAMMAGADFIKTSTGKESTNATLPVGFVMTRAIREYAQETGMAVGFKPAGGIRTAKQSTEWLALMKEELGLPWMKAELFRFGASGLLNDIERQLEHYATGRYSADYRHPIAYGPAPEETKDTLKWLDSHNRRFGHFIGGEWKQPGEKAFFESLDPATGEKLASVAQGSAADIDAAVRAARGALLNWQSLTPHARARYLYAIARAVQRNSRRLAVLETLDNGKPIRESRDIDIPLVARHFYHHAGWAQLLEQEFPEYKACGVVGQIIPWNFPLLMLAWKIAPALAAGNTVVLKPAEFTPLTALAFADICREIGLPAGVVNIVTGDGSTGEALVKHPDIDKIAFTGSTEVGRAIRSATAQSHKRLSLELGGKSPFIIFEDADLDSAVEGLVDGIWFNQGQVCCAGSRLLMQESIAEPLIEKVRDRMSTLRIGSPLDKAIDIGAIVAPVQLDRIRRLVEQGVAEGATCWQPQLEMPARGLYFPPTLLSNVHPTSIVAQQEIFGPVLAAMTFRTPSEAVELANNTVYGLAASVWSESVNVALHVAAQIKAGVVWVNCTNLFDASCGFGGYRESGFGREGGREGLLEYLEPAWFKNAPALPQPKPPQVDTGNGKQHSEFAVDRTVKLYIGGKQARPDSGYSFEVRGKKGELLGEAPLGNRKDIRNAVEAARKASGWAKTTAHNRAQVLYYMAENLSLRTDEITRRLSAMVGGDQAAKEVEIAIERTFSYGAWADKFDGAVHNPPFRTISIAMNEPVGIVGIISPDEAPLLGLLSLVLPVLAAGNTAVVVPSETYPLITGDLYQIFDTSDLPAGAVNLVTGYRSQLLKTLAEHDDLDAIWSFADEASAASAKALSVGNLKQVFTNEGRLIDWFDTKQGEGRWFLEHATQVKNIWVPYGE